MVGGAFRILSKVFHLFPHRLQCWVHCLSPLLSEMLLDLYPLTACHFEPKTIPGRHKVCGIVSLLCAVMLIMPVYSCHHQFTSDPIAALWRGECAPTKTTPISRSRPRGRSSDGEWLPRGRLAKSLARETLSLPQGSFGMYDTMLPLPCGAAWLWLSNRQAYWLLTQIHIHACRFEDCF